MQLVALKLLIAATYLFDTTDAVRYLQVNRMIDAGYLTRLPDGHWVDEVVAWEKKIWAAFQIVISDYAVGYATREKSIAQSLRRNLTTAEQKICGAQKMRKSGGFM